MVGKNTYIARGVVMQDTVVIGSDEHVTPSMRSARAAEGLPIQGIGECKIMILESDFR